MTDKATSGQSVQKSPEGLFLQDGIEGLHSLPRHSVDMLLTDPPYGTTRNFWDVPLPLPELWEAVKWAVKPEGAGVGCMGQRMAAILGWNKISPERLELCNLGKAFPAQGTVEELYREFGLDAESLAKKAAEVLR